MTESDMRLYGIAMRSIRRDMSLTIRDVCQSFDMDSVKLSNMELGVKVSAKLELDKTRIIDAFCHRCEKIHQRHPIKGCAFPSYVCPECLGGGDE